jgi:hypothetical protein
MNKAVHVLILFLCTVVSYGQNSSRQPPKQAADPKLFERAANDLPNFARYDYVPSPRDPFLDKSVTTTIMGAYKPSVLDKLALVSWLNDAGKIVIYVQNMETNEVQRITSEPNKDNFRIIAVHPNADPKLFEVVISNGTEKGPVKFHQIPPNPNPPLGPASSPAAQTKNQPIVTTSPRAPQKKN